MPDAHIAGLGTDDVYAAFSTSRDGLSDSEVRTRRTAEGTNEIVVATTPWWRVLARQYGNFLMALLAGGALLSFVLGESVDGVIILAVLAINGIFGTIQEYKAERLSIALQARITPRVTVRRGGREVVIDRRELVRGDVVLLQNGQVVPADLRITANFGLIIDESALTGESVGVAKISDAVLDVTAATRSVANMISAGTVVLAGGAEGVVTATGTRTELGEIMAFTARAEKRSSFLRQVNELSGFLFRATLLLMGALTLVLALFRSDFGLGPTLLFAIALSVAIVPEMLPLISTVALTKASLALADRGTLVKRLSALEDLGGVEVICTDKTGTITQNILRVTAVHSDDAAACLRVALLASKHTTDPHVPLAGSFDAALWTYASSTAAADCSSVERCWDGAFDPVHRWQFSVVRWDGLLLALKGAPETVIPVCALPPGQQTTWLERTRELGRAGQRVLAVARCSVDQLSSYGNDAVRQCDFLGLIAFEDPVKATASEALRLTKELGVEVKILTGDSPEVAAHTAQAVGMVIDPAQVVTGATLATVAMAELPALVRRTTIFARVNPREKYAIVQLLARDHSVMFLGEGINDAPALKTADVGVVVQEASDIAKEAADIILTKSDLKIIVESILHGRQIMANLGTYILITLTGNFGSLYAISLVATFAAALPLLPTQILLENILTDVPMVDLVNAPLGPRDRAKPAEQRIRSLAFDATILGLVILFTQFVFYSAFRHLTLDLFRTLWLTQIILLEFMLIIALRTREWFWHATPMAPHSRLFLGMVVLLTLALPFLPPVNAWLHLVPYQIGYLVPIGAFCIVTIAMVELMKRWLWHRNHVDSRSYRSAPRPVVRGQR